MRPSRWDACVCCDVLDELDAESYPQLSPQRCCLDPSAKSSDAERAPFDDGAAGCNRASADVSESLAPLPSDLEHTSVDGAIALAKHNSDFPSMYDMLTPPTS